MTSGYSVTRWSEPHAPDPVVLRQNLIAEDYSVYQWSDGPGAAYGLHEHEVDQSHWIISGTLELTVRSVGTFKLSAGDRDFMPAKTHHSARVLGDKPVVYLIGEKVALSDGNKSAEPQSAQAKAT